MRYVQRTVGRIQMLQDLWPKVERRDIGQYHGSMDPVNVLNVLIDQLLIFKNKRSKRFKVMNNTHTHLNIVGEKKNL